MAVEMCMISRVMIMLHGAPSMVNGVSKEVIKMMRESPKNQGAPCSIKRSNTKNTKAPKKQKVNVAPITRGA